jgi:hypothetical protein
MEVFTPEQEYRLREILREEIAAALKSHDQTEGGAAALMRSVIAPASGLLSVRG